MTGYNEWIGRASRHVAAVDLPGEVSLTVRWGLAVDGRPVVVGLDIKAPEITAKVLRSIQINEHLRSTLPDCPPPPPMSPALREEIAARVARNADLAAARAARRDEGSVQSG